MNLLIVLSAAFLLRGALLLPGAVSSAMYDGRPALKAGDVRINTKDGAEMVLVPAGEFLMGSTPEQIENLPEKSRISSLQSAAEDEWRKAELPQHAVALSGYWVYKYEVTVAQYRKYCAETGRQMPKAPESGWLDDHPIAYITWREAANYATWAGLSLPSEAQWEKAARGTDGRIYPWGNDYNRSKCNRRANGLMRTEPVGSYPEGASPYGCMDMAGNVWEWCSDWYSKDYYSKSPAINPTGPERGGYRILRGGKWRTLTRYYRCSSRLSYPPSYRSYSIGFRLVQPAL